MGGSLRCMDEQINQMDTPCFLVHHYARGSVTTMKWGPSHKIARPIVFPFAAQIYSAILHTKQRQRWCTDPASLIMNGRHPEWPPRRAALPISSLDSGQRSVAARRSGAAPGMSAAALLSLTQQFTVYIGRILDIPHQSTG